jgi:uncharacterized protein YcnI
VQESPPVVALTPPGAIVISLPRLRHVVGATAAVAAMVLATAGTAAAHIDPDVSQIPAGGDAVVFFKVEHGCGESPTTKLEIKVPKQITNPVAATKAGWKTSTDADNVVTFEDGTLDPHTEDSFAITFTAPTKVGSKVRFPIIQTCQKGEIDWIETHESDEHPAPVITIGKAGSKPVASKPDDDEGGDEGGEATTTTAKSTTTKPAAAASTKAKEDDAGNGPLIAGVVAVVVVLAGGGLLFARSRKTA